MKGKGTDWQVVGQMILVAWMVVVFILFFTQFLTEIDTGIDVVRRALRIP